MSLTVEALAQELTRLDTLFPDIEWAPEALATILLPFIERHIAAGQQECMRAFAELSDAAGLMLAEIDTCGHEVDPAYRTTLYEAWEKSKPLIAATPQPPNPAPAPQPMTTQGEAVWQYRQVAAPNGWHDIDDEQDAVRMKSDGYEVRKLYTGSQS